MRTRKRTKMMIGPCTTLWPPPFIPYRSKTVIFNLHECKVKAPTSKIAVGKCVHAYVTNLGEYSPTIIVKTPPQVGIITAKVAKVIIDRMAKTIMAKIVGAKIMGARIVGAKIRGTDGPSVM